MLTKCMPKSARTTKYTYMPCWFFAHLQAHKSILFHSILSISWFYYYFPFEGLGRKWNFHLFASCASFFARLLAPPLRAYFSHSDRQHGKCDNNRLATSKEDLIKKFFFNQPIKTFEIFCEYKMLDLICKRKKKIPLRSVNEVALVLCVRGDSTKLSHSHLQAHDIFMLSECVREFHFPLVLLNFREVFNMLLALALKWQNILRWCLQIFRIFSFSRHFSPEKFGPFFLLLRPN